jgi:hypothetical protein
MAAPECELGLPGLDRLDEIRKSFRRVASIGVHDHDGVPGGGLTSLQDGGGESHSVSSREQTVRSALPESSDHLSSSIGRAVVDDDHFMPVRLESGIDPLVEQLHALPLIVRGEHEADLKRVGHGGGR